MCRLFLFSFFFSYAITAAAWSSSPTAPSHQSPLQQLPPGRTRSNEQSLILISPSKSEAFPVSYGGSTGGGSSDGGGGGGGNRGEVPGGSPLRLCEESRDTDLYAIDYIELQPFPLYM